MQLFLGGICGRRLFGEGGYYRGPLWHRRATQAAFSPDDIAGLVAWFTPDFGTYSDSGLTTPVSADGSAVGGWDNQATGVTDATQGTAGSRPTLKTNIQNGLPILRCDGSDDFLGVTTYTTSAMTLLAVFKGENMMFGGSAANEYVWAKNGSNAFEVSYGGGTFPTFAFTGQTTAFHLITIKHSGTNISVYKDGALVSTSAETAGQDLTYIGKYAGGLNFSGDLGDVLLYNTAISDSDRETIEAFEMERWGL